MAKIAFLRFLKVFIFSCPMCGGAVHYSTALPAVELVVLSSSTQFTQLKPSSQDRISDFSGPKLRLNHNKIFIECSQSKDMAADLK